MKRRPTLALLIVSLCAALLVGCHDTIIEESPAIFNLPEPIVEESSAPPPSTIIATIPDNFTETTPVPSVAQSVEPTALPAPAPASFDVGTVPEFSDKPYVAVNGNEPYFLPADQTTNSFEYYSSLDSLGRCGVAFACVGQDLMPAEERSEIGMIKPSGWHTIRYDDLVDGKYLYNRCHLIGYQLSGENANTSNLITGTRYLNIQGMLPFENMVADYVKETGNHVLYRVTPIFEGDNLLASGVLMEGLSVEDEGAGVCYCVYAYNAQPYVEIDYSTGDSARSADAPSVPTPSPTPKLTPTPTPDNSPSEPPTNDSSGSPTYIGNKNTKKFHYPNCSSVDQMKDSNKVYFYGNRDELIDKGYSPCGRCHP